MTKYDMRQWITLIENSNDAARQPLNELFNQSVNIQIWGSNEGLVNGAIRVGRESFQFALSRSVEDDLWELMLASGNKSETEMSNTMKAVIVFNGIMKVVEDFIQTRQPSTIRFVASGSRAKLYSTLVDRHKDRLRAIGYDIKITKHEPRVDFEITKKDSEISSSDQI